MCVGGVALGLDVYQVAESLGHHPDLSLTSFRNVAVELYTHSVGGLTEFDIRLAEALDALPVAYSPKFLREQNARLELEAPLPPPRS